MEDNTPKNLTLEQKARLLTGGGYWTTARIQSADIKPVRFSDGPTGLRPQGEKGDYLGGFSSFPATCFPTHSALACSWNKQLGRAVGKNIGEEACFYNVDVVLAPALNIKRNPLCGRNFEYFSEDPYLNGKMGAAFSAGLKSAGAEACVKHFAVNNREFARMVVDSAVDGRTFREIYLTGFEIAVKEGKPAAVMTAYNRVNGVYCNENPHLIGDILRGEWGFDGIVVSDWGGTSDRVAAVKAGADLEMPPCKFTAGEIESAVKEGRLGIEEVDVCADRIIRLSKREKKAASFDFDAHAAFAAKAAEECAVLLKNDGTLPLKGGKTALIGEIAESPLIQGGGSSKVNPKHTETLLNCLKDKIAGYAKGYKRGKSGKILFKRALKLCKSVDNVIFCVGHYGDLEGADRESLSLPQNQIKLLNAIAALNKKVIVVLFCGSAVETDWDKNINSLLYAGLSGQSGAKAVAEILYGSVCPSGKLAETFTLSLDGVPSTQYFAKQPYGEIYGEGADIGYFYGRAAKYPFGFGLSYTRFEYSDLRVDGMGASFTVTNAGDVRGGEVAQMYLGFPDGAHSPKIQLKGFEKVFLDAGESARISIPFDEYAFRSYDTLNKVWAQVDGRYKVLICSSSQDIRLEGCIDKSGGVQSVPPAVTYGLSPAEYPVKRNRRGRVIADYRTPLCELKNAKGLFGRLFAKIALGAVGKNKTVYGSMQYLPLRTMAQFGKMEKNTLDGMIEIFNGKFFKGLKTLLKKSDKKRG